MRQICMSGSMRGVWKRSYGRAAKAPPDERGGNRHARPNVTAPHPDSTDAKALNLPLTGRRVRRSPARRSLVRSSASPNALDGPAQPADFIFRHRRQFAGGDEQRLAMLMRRGAGDILKHARDVFGPGDLVEGK